MQRSLSRPEPSTPIANDTRGHEKATVFVSVVWAIDGPRFVAVATAEENCLAQIARYVAEQAQWQLWPPTASRVTALLGEGDQAGAVTEYFRCVGERWDAERLTTARLGLGPASGVWSGGLPLLSAYRPARPTRNRRERAPRRLSSPAGPRVKTKGLLGLRGCSP
jgi:hypothetical protein